MKMPLLKVAIFEDEFLLAHDLKSQMEKSNYEVVAIFRKAEEGLRYFEDILNFDKLPDIVLMDVSLAGKMNGVEAARIMITKYNFALIFLTGMSQLGVFEEAFETKPQVVLIKPFDIQQALVSIRLALYQKSLETKLLKYQMLELDARAVMKAKALESSVDVEIP
jgi:DNA-binding response OmpR family regulator